MATRGSHDLQQSIARVSELAREVYELILAAPPGRFTASERQAAERLVRQTRKLQDLYMRLPREKL